MSHHRRGFSSPPSVFISKSFSGSTSSPSLVTPHEEDRRLEFLYRRPSAIQASQYEVTSTVESTTPDAWWRVVFVLLHFVCPLGVGWACRIRYWSSELLSRRRSSSSPSACACTASWMARWVMLRLLLATTRTMVALWTATTAIDSQLSGQSCLGLLRTYVFARANVV